MSRQRASWQQPHPWYQSPPLAFSVPKARKVREEFMFGSEPIIGYRVWRVGTRPLENYGDLLGLLADAHDAGAENPYRHALELSRQKFLTPVAADGHWLPEVSEARCYRGSHPAPALQCECGYWALRDEQQLVPAFVSYAPQAWGTVKLWGRFVEFEKGYRAQYAYPERITLLGKDAALADELSRTYGVPVECGDVPATVAEALRAEAERAERALRDMPPRSFSSIASQIFLDEYYGGMKKRRGKSWGNKP